MKKIVLVSLLSLFIISSGWSQKKFYHFKIGEQKIDNITVRVTIPDIPAVNCVFSKLPSDKSGKIKIIMNLYDRNKQLFKSEESFCKKNSSYQSWRLLFTQVSKDEVKKIKYFTFSIKECR